MLPWSQLQTQCAACTRCGLAQTRRHVVLGEGSHQAVIMFIGEGPGADEDASGRPFVGRAGQLLNRGLSALGIVREDVYIANVVKCRPPQNRVPTEEEAQACLDWLRNQVYLIRPRIIVCLGATAVRYVIGRDARITKIRGSWQEQKGVWIMPTYHPAALLRDESKKRPFWEDLQNVHQKYQQLQAGEP